MYTNKRKTIGVFLCRVMEDFQKELCHGISVEARRYGYNVAVFSWYGNFMKNELLSSGDKMILDLPDFKELDGIIIALDTMDDQTMIDELMSKLEPLRNIPIVSVRTETDKFYNVLVDDSVSIEGMVRHFTDVHGFTDINFLAGPKGYIDSDLRLECFKKVMKEKGLPVEDRQIIYGDFWRESGPLACKQWIDEEQHIPEAIICANDYMAIALCEELIDRDIVIPKDVAISGYDGTPAGRCISPMLTSVYVPFDHMGAEAVDIIRDVNNHLVRDHNTYIGTEVYVSESCGCPIETQKTGAHNRKDFYARMVNESEVSSLSTYMAVELGNAENMEGIREIFARNVHNMPGIQRFNLCTSYGLEDTLEPTDYAHGFGEDMKLAFSLDGKGKLMDERRLFKKRTLLPESIVDRSAQCYYFFPVPYRERSFGYIALDVGNQGGYSMVMQNWAVILGNSLDGMFNRIRMNRLIFQLEELHVKDVVTGLYNRSGYEKYAEELFEKAKREKKEFFIAMVDLDGLKQINDQFGHSEGDIAIIEIARALRNAGNGREICARMGGDEYSVAALYTKEQSAQYMKDFETCLNRTNMDLGKNYTIAASVGYTTEIPDERDTLESFLKISDNLMYQQKCIRKKKKYK